MKRKSYKLCAEFGCTRAVVFPEAARTNPAMRYCKKHPPMKMMAQRRNLKPKAENAAKNSEPVDVVPLVCFYKDYHVVGDRTVFVKDICGRPAPRRSRGNRSLPKYPNRFNEPLCAAHAHFANDEIAFPGEVPEVPAWPNEKVEANARSVAKIGHRPLVVDSVKALLALDLDKFTAGHAVRVKGLRAFAQMGADRKWRRLPKHWPWTIPLRGETLKVAQVLEKAEKPLAIVGTVKLVTGRECGVRKGVKYTHFQRWLPSYTQFKSQEKIHASFEGTATVCGLVIEADPFKGEVPRRGSPESKIYVWRTVQGKGMNCPHCWNKMVDSGAVEVAADAYDVVRRGAEEREGQTKREELRQVKFCAVPHVPVTHNPFRLPVEWQRKACGMAVGERTVTVVKSQSDAHVVVAVSCATCLRVMAGERKMRKKQAKLVRR